MSNDNPQAPAAAAPVTVDQVVDYLQNWYQQGYTGMNRNGDNVLNSSDALANDPATTRQFLENSNIDIAKFAADMRAPLAQFTQKFDVDNNGVLSAAEQRALSERMQLALTQFNDPQGVRTAENMVKAISESLGVQSDLPNVSTNGTRER